MSKLDKKQSIDDLLKGMNQEEAKKLRNENLIKLIIVTPALILGISYGGSFIAGLLLGLGSASVYLVLLASIAAFLCSFVVGGIYCIKKVYNLFKIQMHLRKMKRPLDELLPDMRQAETKKLRNKDLIKLMLVAPALILVTIFGSDLIAQIIVGVLSGMYFFTSAALSFALTGNPDSFQVGWSFSPLIFALRMVILLGSFVAVGIYAVRKVRNLYKIKKHLSTLRRT